MKDVVYNTRGVCARTISFQIDDESKIRDLSFSGGCNGNLKAIARLCEGKNANEIASILEGNTCGMKGTSCADQLAKAIKANI